MSIHYHIIQEIDEYAAKAGLEPSTVCRNATGNPRLRERLLRRLEQADADMEKLRAFMEKNPVPAREGA